MNRRAQANRTPWLVFGSIFVLAIIAKLLSPADPIVPGPKGSMQIWSSKISIGTMADSSVNPAGTMWAGVWNAKDKEGKDHSSIVIIDFEKQSSDHKEYSSKTDAITWTSDTKAEPAASEKKSVSPATPAFTQEQLPGIIEGTWESPAGILMLCKKFDTFSAVVFDKKTNKLNVMGKDGFTTDVKANWPAAPKEMSFVTYRGGFKVDLATAKAKKIFDYKELDADADHWRSYVQDGRLYPRKGGGYTSVSYAEGLVDIRALDKDGKLEKNLLPRN